VRKTEEERKKNNEIDSHNLFPSLYFIFTAVRLRGVKVSGCGGGGGAVVVVVGKMMRSVNRKVSC